MGGGWNFLFLAGLYVVLPIAAAKNMGASWKAVGTAYAIWTALVLVIGMAMGRDLDEGLGLSAVLAMFLSLIAVPLLIWALRRRGLR